MTFTRTPLIPGNLNRNLNTATTIQQAFRATAPTSRLTYAVTTFRGFNVLGRRGIHRDDGDRGRHGNRTFSR